MHYLIATIFMFVSFVFSSVALAQTNGELLELAQPVLDAVLGGRYAFAAALALVLGVALLRRFGGAKWPLLASKKVAPWLVMVGSFGAALAVALPAGTAVSMGLLWGAFKLAAGASFSYAMLKPLLGKIPYIGAIFTSKSRAENAQIAGLAALDANPSTGIPMDFKDVE